MEGASFGRYQLLELLGRGGMGEVWRAYDTETNNRTVAIKLLPPHLAEDRVFVERFRREADAAARLNNPHIIPIHNYGEIGGRLYVDMRLVEGRDLQQVLAAGPMEPGRAVRIIEQVAKALHAAHKIGLVHRDVKPSNVLVDEDDFAYLIDFGIARSVDETSLTTDGSFIGSLHYMAPERLRSREADARADIYALTCVLYECLTGSRPFPGDSAESQVTAHLTEPPPRLSPDSPNVPRQFDAVIAKGMAKDPDQRYATTVELARDARDVVTDPIPHPSPLARTEIRSAPGSTEMVTTNLRAPENPPAGAPSERWWRRKTILIPAILSIIAVIAVGAVLASTRERGSSATSSPSTTQALSTMPAPSSTRPPSATQHTFGAQTLVPFTDLAAPNGVAVDSAGSVWVADAADTPRILKLPSASDPQTALPFTGLGVPKGIAVDAAGKVYVTDEDNNRVLTLAPNSTMQEVLPLTGTHNLNGVAVDSAGSVYVADSENNRVVKLPGGSGHQEVLPFTGLQLPIGVAVDAAGTVYVADSDNNRVVKLPGGSGQQEVLPFSGLNGPFGLAVDGAGSVFVADQRNSRVVELPGGSGQQKVLPFKGLATPWGIAVDDAGSVYVTDATNLWVVKLPAG